MAYNESSKRGAQIIRVKVIDQVMRDRGVSIHLLSQITEIEEITLLNWWENNIDIQLTDFIKILGALGIVIDFSIKENIDDQVDGFNYEHLN